MCRAEKIRRKRRGVMSGQALISSDMGIDRQGISGGGRADVGFVQFDIRSVQAAGDDGQAGDTLFWRTIRAGEIMTVVMLMMT